MPSKMEQTILGLAKQENKEQLVRTLNGIDLEKLGSIITSRTNENHCDAATFLQAVFKGSPHGNKDGLQRRSFLFNHCMDILSEDDISSKLATEYLGVLLLEIDKTSSEILCELADKIVENIRKGLLKNGRVLQLFPKILSSIASRESIPLPSDAGGELSGVQYKSQMINTLCSTKWHSNCVIHLANMFREVVLTNEELKFVIEKILRMIKSLELESIAPVVYQLLILCSKGHRIFVLEGVIAYFNQLDIECAQNEPHARDDFQGISSDQLRHTEGNVILHITFAIKQDQELGKEYVKYLKACQQRPQKILTAFNLAIALSVAQIHRFEEPIFDIFKAAVLKSFKSVKLRNASKWMQDNVESMPDISKEILQTVQNSMFGWDHVTQGIVQLGFYLMDTFQSKNRSEASNIGQSTPQQESCQLGSQILLKTFKVHDIIRTEILEQIFNRLLTKATSASNHYIDLLQKAVASNPQALLDSLSKVKEVFEYLPCLPFATAQGLLQAVLPLMKISITLRDSLMLVLRKAVFSRNLEARKIAVSGFLLVLKHFKVRGGNITSSQTLSQGSQSSVHSSSQILVDVHNTSGRSNTGNEALCLEIIGGLRRCFNQQADIRVLLYEGLSEVLSSNSELEQAAMEIVHKHFLKYYEIDDEILPPVKLDPCLTASGDQIFLAEPLGHLLCLLQQSLVRGLRNEEGNEEDDQEETNHFTENVQGIFTSLTQRMNKSDLEDFELDKSADYSIASGVGVKNNIYACLVLGILEVLMEHSFTVGECSLESCEIVLELFNKYWKLSNVVKENATQGKKTRQSSSKQIARSMLSLRTTTNILKAILSDSLPSHQIGLDILRNSGDFVQYVLTVTHQKLSQINDNGNCDGVGGKDLDHIYSQCTKIAGVLLKMVNGDSCIPKKSDKIVNQSLHGVFLVINIIGNRYRRKIHKFLAKLDRDNDEDETVVDENELVHRHIKKFQRLAVTTLASPNDTMTLKDVSNMVNIISLLTKCLKPGVDQLSQIQSWTKRICVEHDIDDVMVSKSLVSFMLSLTTQCSNKLTLEKEMAADIHKQLGDIDEDIELTGDSYFAIINQRTAAPNVLAVLLSQTDKVLDEIDWFMTKVKADKVKTTTENQEKNGESQLSQKSTVDKAVCERITSIVHVFHEFVQSAIPVGSSTELLLKTLTKFYSTLGVVAKYYLYLYAQKAGHATPSFEKIVCTSLCYALDGKILVPVKCSGTQLSQQVYAFLTYAQTAEQETRGKGKNKDSGKTGNITKVRVLKEMKSVPNLIYAVEQYERYLIQLSKKSKINFMEHFKRSTSRDFRINGATLDAALRDESSEEDETDITTENTEEPPKKKGKK